MSQLKGYTPRLKDKQARGEIFRAFQLAKEALRDTMKPECYQKIYDYGNFSN